MLYKLWLWRDAQDKGELRWWGKCWFGKGQGFDVGSWWLSFFEEDILETWWQKHLFSGHWVTVWHHPKGLLEKEWILCYRGTVNVTAFTDRTAVPPGLASPVSLHCWSAQLRGAKLVGTLKPLQCFVHCWTFGTHAQGWESTVCTHDLKFWVPFFICITGAQPRLRPHFISIGQTKTIPTSILFTV